MSGYPSVVQVGGELYARVVPELWNVDTLAYEVETVAGTSAHPEIMSIVGATTAADPTQASVGVASGQVLASNASRKGLTLVNTSTNNISIGIGKTAVLNSGITLTPNGAWEMDPFTFSTAAINAIAGGAASVLAIQEWS